MKYEKHKHLLLNVHVAYGHLKEAGTRTTSLKDILERKNLTLPLILLLPEMEQKGIDCGRGE